MVVQITKYIVKLFDKTRDLNNIFDFRDLDLRNFFVSKIDFIFKDFN